MNVQSPPHVSHIFRLLLTVLLCGACAFGCATAESPGEGETTTSGATTTSGTSETGGTTGGTTGDTGGTTTSTTGGDLDVGVDTGDDVGEPDTGDDTGSPDVGEDTDEPDVAPDTDEPDVSDPNEAPTAVVAGPVVGIAGMALDFDGSGSSDIDGDVVAWDWDFGDGEEGSGELTDHIYAAAGEYSATLTVTDDDGAQDTTTFDVIVSDPSQVEPVAVIAFDDPVAVVSETTVVRGDSSFDPDGDVVAWDWTVTEQSTGASANYSGATIDLTFAQSGLYTISLTVTDNDDRTTTHEETYKVGVRPSAVIEPPGGPFEPGISVPLDGSGSTDEDGSIIGYAWDFGDGQSASMATTSHAYQADGTYTVRLTVTDDDGLTGSVETFVGVTTDDNAAPVANAGSDVAGAVGESVAFSSAASSDTDGFITLYAWDFGDGGGSNDPNPTHTFIAEGSYTVTLTVTDNEGATASDTLTATITRANQPPTANAGVDRSVVRNTTLSFDGSGSNDPDGTITQYAWEWGDGSSSQGMNAQHAWSQTGTYTVRLTVTDNDGATASDTATITVQETNQPPVASFTASPNPADVNEPVQFNAGASSDPNGDLLTNFAWNFGDGSNGTGLNPTHSYAAEGSYTVQLTVTDPGGLTNTTTRTVNVVCGESCYGGLFRKRYFAPTDENPAGGTCDPAGTPDEPADDYYFEIGPRNCTININNGSMTMNCDGTTYTGNFFSDGTFSVTGELNGNAPFDPIALLCGSDTVEERISGTYNGYDTWSGTSNITYEFDNSFFCPPCVYNPISVFGIGQ